MIDGPIVFPTACNAKQKKFPANFLVHASFPHQQEYLLNKEHDGDIVIPQSIEEQMDSVQKVLTKHNKTNHDINYNDFVAAVMWRRLQYDEEKVGR